MPQESTFDDRNADAVARGPEDAGVGYAFITLVEPHDGHELAYTRWYDDDHFYSGAMAFPWWFAGRRWIAPADMRAVRAGVGGPAELDRGWTLGTYWISRGRVTEQARWLETAVARLRAAGRMFDERTHVKTGYFEFRAEWQRAGHEPRAVHALDYPYQGLVLEIVDRSSGDWSPTTFVQQRLARGDAAQCIAFSPLPWPGGGTTRIDYGEVDPAHTVLVWFLEESPRDRWDDTFAGHTAELAAAGARLSFLGGFLPTLPGTTQYLDQIR